MEANVFVSKCPAESKQHEGPDAREFLARRSNAVHNYRRMLEYQPPRLGDRGRYPTKDLGYWRCYQPT